MSHCKDSFGREELATLAEHPSAVIRRRVAGNPNTPVEVLDLLATEFPDEVLGLLRFLAMSKPGIFDELSAGARTSLARCESCPEQLIKRFAEDERAKVRAGAAKNPYCPPGWLEVLERDVDEVRAGAAENWALPVERIAALAQHDECEGVRAGAGANPALPEPLMTEEQARSPELRRGLARNPYAPDDLLLSFAKDGPQSLRLKLADNEDAGFDPLVALASDSEPRVRMKLVKNPGAPPRALKRLNLYWGGAMLPRAVARHPNTPNTVLEQLATDGVTRRDLSIAENPGAPEQLLRDYAERQDVRILRRLAGNPATPEDILRQLRSGADDLTSLVARFLLSESQLEQGGDE